MDEVANRVAPELSNLVNWIVSNYKKRDIPTTGDDAPDLWTKLKEYGTQCRRAGAEAAVQICGSCDGRWPNDECPHAKNAAYANEPSPCHPRATEAASPAAGWRPIASAPKDGTYVILFDPDAPDDVLEGGYREDMQRWLSRGGTKLSPTLWMPLPPAPSEEARAG